jgi:hypothetical protein
MGLDGHPESCEKAAPEEMIEKKMIAVRTQGLAAGLLIP